jgi:UDP-glucose 4-epimerase
MKPRQRLLLTGATGFIGSHLWQRLREADAEVIALTRRPDTSTASVVCDLSQPLGEQAVQLPEVTAVVHLAALMPKSSVPQESIEENIAANLTATLNLAKALPGNPYFVYASSVDVYGCPASLPVTENHPTDPVTYYGAAKLAAEKFLQVFCKDAGIPLLILRLTQVYGAGEPAIKVIPRTIAAVAEGTPPILHGDGSDSRDYIHADDVAEVILRAVRSRPSGIVNVASGKSRSIIEVIRTILRVSGRDLTPRRQPGTKPALHLAFDVSRLKQMLGEIPQKEFEQGLREQYEHHLRSGRNAPGRGSQVLPDLPGSDERARLSDAGS